MTLDAWLSAADGDASGFWLQSLVADLAFPESFVWGQMAAVARLDAQAAHRLLLLRQPEARFEPRRRGNRRSSGVAAGWPTPGRLLRTRTSTAACATSNVETLLIGGALDFPTPPQSATKELLPTLPNGRQVVLPGFGHTTSFWTEQPEAGTRLINTYLATGKVDDSLYEPQSVDFTPEVTQTALAKGIAGTMVGLARPHRALAAVDGPPGAQAGTLRPEGERDCCDRCTRSCSAWAAGSSAS